MNKKTMIVTSGLPYANGPIHLGHLVEYLQTDFWVRFHKMQERECFYICADDTHGTPIMIKARKLGITPEELIEKSYEEHEKDFADFEVNFDHYSSTHSEANKAVVDDIFQKMQEQGHVEVRTIEQLYCEHEQMFLPDRFVKGSCPKCQAADQYGDSCDVCGATYSPMEMKDPRNADSGKPLTRRESEHVFFKLSNFQSFLREWVPEHTASEVSNKLQEWLKDDLRDWDISRDEPYFGFEIPGMPKKYFYVWVDAPVGYISTTQEWCKKENRDWDALWKKGEADVYHFIGKDIVYFHTLFWPAMLKAGGYTLPQQVFVHGFLNVNGAKMSKSKGTFISARTYLNHLDATYLRYYYACKLNSSVEDIDLNLEDFTQKVNADLIGKITNLGSRGAQMLGKKCEGKMTSPDLDGAKLIQMAQEKGEVIAQHFQERNFSKGMTEIRQLAEEGNRYFDAKAPWTSIKTNPEEAQKVLTTTINYFRIMAIYLKPILPSYVAKVEALLAEEPYLWKDAQKVLENYTIGKFEHLAKRVESKSVEAIVEESTV